MNTQLNIVTSAADGCGQPLSIRSMDHLPSRDHKGAEYKESFMLSNRSSVSRGYSSAVAALATAACIGLASTASAGTIYQDSFTGSATPGTLNGAAPTVGPVGATWTANSSSSYGWADNGIETSPSNAPTSRQNAYLPFTPSSGQIYTLSAGIAVTAKLDSSSDSNHWVALGFITNPTTGTGYDVSGASPWVLSAYNGASGAVFTGPGTAGGTGFANTAGVNDYSIVLNTGSSAWTYQVYQTNSSVTNLLLTPTPITVATEAISAVGIEQGFGNVQVSNFSLTSSPAPVPEPATLGLFAIGGAGLLLAARKRKTQV